MQYFNFQPGKSEIRNPKSEILSIDLGNVRFAEKCAIAFPEKNQI